MTKPVFTTAVADLQILEIDAWWRANREKAPDKFEEELAVKGSGPDLTGIR